MYSKFISDPNEKKENEFTGMPGNRPFPDFEPENSIHKQHEQFEDTATTGQNDVNSD